MVPMVRTQVQLTEVQVKRLKALASQRGVSVAELVRESVDRHLSTALTLSGLRERAISAIGGFRSDSRDTSENHDKYLAEAYAD